MTALRFLSWRVVAAAGLAAVLGAHPVGAQAAGGDQADTTLLNRNLRSVDFGVRLTGIRGDEARAQRFDDRRSGPLLQSFRFTDDTGSRVWRVSADNLGYRDQRVLASVEQLGRVHAWFEYRQIPYYLHDITRSVFDQAGPTTLRTDDALRQGIQGGTATLAGSADAFARTFEQRTMRDVTEFGVRYHATQQMDVNVRLRSTGRDGTQPFGAGFGFASAIEVPAPIDERTTDIDAHVEWTNRRGLLRVGYDGSLYQSNAETQTWDNPARITDAPGGPAQGRMSRWPSSSTHGLSATGSMALPARSRLVAYVSRANWSQDVDMLPHTINTAIAAPALERTSVQGDVDVTAALVRVTSRPSRWSWFQASYRAYDFDNRTPVLNTPQRVNFDASLVTASAPQSAPLSFTRGLLELDASLTPWRHGAFRVGYSREAVDRAFRLFEQTVDQGVRVAYDWTSNPYVTLRASYLHSERRGTGLDEEVLSDLGEQVSLRQFDISDRIRDQAQFIVTATPLDMLSVHLVVAAARDDRPDAFFGLTDQTVRSFGGGVDFVPADAVVMGLAYNYDTFASLQRSRQANPGPQFDDPTRDWSTDARERVHQWTASVDLPRVWREVDLAMRYDINRSRSRYGYGLVPGSPLAPVVQLTPVRNDWYQGSVDMRYWLRQNFSIGAGYLYDRFTADDFAFSPSTLDRLVFPSTLLMQYTWRPYTANTVWLRATYLW